METKKAVFIFQVLLIKAESLFQCDMILKATEIIGSQVAVCGEGI